jgi:RNA polymerase sigma-70 factor (ECF subfamily)
LFPKNLVSKTDEELMVQVIDHHSHAAIMELHRRYSQKLLGYFIKMLQKDVDLAQDFVQEIFLRILEKKHLFDPEKKFYNWLFTIASNMCKTTYRRTPFNSFSKYEFELNRFSHLADDLAGKAHFKLLLDKSIDSLEHGQKTVFVLRYMEHFSLQEIADIMETSIGTVKSRLFYATQKIAQQLKEFDPRFETQLFKLN